MKVKLRLVGGGKGDGIRPDVHRDSQRIAPTDPSHEAATPISTDQV
jgi:hypothetical protein